MEVMVSLAYGDSYKTILESNNAKLGNYGFEYLYTNLLRKAATIFPSSVVSFYKLKKSHLLIYRN